MILLFSSEDIVRARFSSGFRSIWWSRRRLCSRFRARDATFFFLLFAFFFDFLLLFLLCFFSLEREREKDRKESRLLRVSIARVKLTLTIRDFLSSSHRRNTTHRIYKKIRQPRARPVHGPRTTFSTGMRPSSDQPIVPTKAVSFSSRSISLRIIRSNRQR